MTESELIVRLIEPLYRVRSWIRFCGLLSIIQGVLSIASLVGILFCWLPIWMGVLLYKASNQLTLAREAASEEQFQGALKKLATYFKIFGITLAVMLIVAICGVLAAIVIPAFVGYRQAGMG